MGNFPRNEFGEKSDSAKAILVCVHLSQLTSTFFLVKIQPEYINIHLLVVPNSTIFDDDGFFFHVYNKLHNNSS